MRKFLLTLLLVVAVVAAYTTLQKYIVDAKNAQG